MAISSDPGRRPNVGRRAGRAQTFPVRDVSPLADNAELMSTAVDSNGNTTALWSMLGPTGAQLAVRSSRHDVATDTWSPAVDLVRRPNAFDPHYGFEVVTLPSGDAWPSAEPVTAHSTARRPSSPHGIR